MSRTRLIIFEGDEIFEGDGIFERDGIFEGDGIFKGDGGSAGIQISGDTNFGSKGGNGLGAGIDVLVSICRRS